MCLMMDGNDTVPIYVRRGRGIYRVLSGFIEFISWNKIIFAIVHVPVQNNPDMFMTLRISFVFQL